MYYPSNNWYIVRQNRVGTWRVEAQQGCFFIPCPSRRWANRVRDYLMYWLASSHFYRLSAICPFVRRLVQGEITFDEFFKQVKFIHLSDRQEF